MASARGVVIPTFDLRQRFAIWDEVGMLIDDALTTCAPIEVTVEADRLTKSYPESGLSRDQIVMRIIDTGKVAAVVMEFSPAA